MNLTDSASVTTLWILKSVSES